MIHGSLVPNLTFFTERGEVDPELTRWHMDWVFGHGADGLFLTGSYGAGPLMTNDERAGIFRLARDVADRYEDRSLIAHVGCADTASSVALARAAEDAGVDAVGVVPPFYYKYEEDKVVGYYADIVRATALPVYAYNNPETTRFTFTLNTVRKLQEVGVKGVKDSSMNVKFLSTVYYDAKLGGKDFQVIIGTSTGWLPFYYMGIDTMIAGMCNYAPEVLTAMYRWTVAGDRDRSERAYAVMMELVEQFKFTDSTIASHMALHARGFDAGFPRKPMVLPPFDHPKYGELKAAIDRALDQIDALRGD
jgi:dihydrodipicolinate synthase/N-acetylneuraminate lyase